MKLNFLRHAVCIILNCLGINEAFSQELSGIRNQKPFEINGSIGFNAMLYQAKGIAPRNQALNLSAFGNANVSIYGIALPFSFFWANAKTTFTQPFNQYGISPTYKWITLHAGYRNMSLSKYSMNGFNFFGGGLELNPGKFRFMALYGRFSKAVRETEFSGIISSPSSFERRGMGIKLGLGTSKTFFDIFVLKAGDNANSLAGLKDSLIPKSKENLVTGFNGKIGIFKRLSLHYELAVSLFSRNTQDSLIPMDKLSFVHQIFPIRNSTSIYSAGEASLNYNANNFQLKLGYKRIDPDYQSMGLYFVQSDNETFSLDPSFQLWKGKFRINGSVGYQRDNLAQNRIFTTNRIISGLNVSFAPNARYSGDFSYSNFGISQINASMGLATAYIDTIRIAQNNQSISLSNRYVINNKTHRNTFIVMVSRQNLSDLNRITANQNENIIWFINGGYTRTHTAHKTSFNVSINASQTDNAFFSTQLIGPSLGFSKKTKKEKIALQSNLSMQIRNNRGFKPGMVVTSNSAANFKLGKSHAFQIGLMIIRNTSGNENIPTFTEIRFNAGYVLIFNSSNNGK